MFNEKKERHGETQITLNYFDFHSPFQSNVFFYLKKISPHLMTKLMVLVCCVHFTNISNMSSIYLINFELCLVMH